MFGVNKLLAPSNESKKKQSLPKSELSHVQLGKPLFVIIQPTSAHKLIISYSVRQKVEDGHKVKVL